MTVRQLVFTGPRTAAWTDVAEPGLGSGRSALVAPLAVSTCDMDAVALSGAIRFRPGTPLGHEGVGVIVAVGDEVAAHRVGDRVIVPWQISCGHCPRCRRGQDAFCSSVPAGSCYGWGPHVERWGGFLTDRFEVPFADHMLVPLPDGLDPVRAAGLGDNLVDAWRTVGPPLRETGGGRVLVAGAGGDDGGSIGLYAVAQAVALGAEEVVYLSGSPLLRRHAAGYGAMALDPATVDLRDLGWFEVGVDTSGDPELLAAVVRAAGPHGIVTCTAGAVHRAAPVPLPVYEMYLHAVTLRTGWVSTRALLEEPLHLARQEAFDPVEVARVAPIDDAVEAFQEPFVKLVLTAAP